MTSTGRKRKVLRVFALLIVLHAIALIPLSFVSEGEDPCPYVMEMNDGSAITSIHTDGCFEVAARAGMLSVVAMIEVIVVLWSIVATRRLGVVLGLVAAAFTLVVTGLALKRVDGVVTHSALVGVGWSLGGIVAAIVVATELFFSGLLLPPRAYEENIAR